MAIYEEKYESVICALFPELSGNEAKAVYLYAQGCSIRMIADDTSVAANTVKSHLERAKQKFGVFSRSELGVICTVRLNLLILKTGACGPKGPHTVL